VTVAEANHSHYCICGRTALAKASGCTEEEIVDARRGASTDRRLEAPLQFAKELVEKRGWVTDEEFRRVRDAGYDDREITEIIASVGLFIFGDYLTQVAETEVDFPEVAELAGV
jgi:alkylhydroperoxidase family enzyme